MSPGRVRLKLYKGNTIVIGARGEQNIRSTTRTSSPSRRARVAYDHRDAAGFIKLNALRLRTLGQRKEEA